MIFIHNSVVFFTIIIIGFGTEECEEQTKHKKCSKILFLFQYSNEYEATSTAAKESYANLNEQKRQQRNQMAVGSDSTYNILRLV